MTEHTTERQPFKNERKLSNGRSKLSMFNPKETIISSKKSSKQESIASSNQYFIHPNKNSQLISIPTNIDTKSPLNELNEAKTPQSPQINASLRKYSHRGSVPELQVLSSPITVKNHDFENSYEKKPRHSLAPNSPNTNIFKLDGSLAKRNNSSNLHIPRLKEPSPDGKSKIPINRSRSDLNQLQLKPINPTSKRTGKDLWAKAKNIVKGIISFQKMSKNIQLFGVSEENLDNNYKYINSLKRIQTIINKDDKTEDEQEGKKKKFKFGIIHPESKFMILWNILIAIFMVHNVLITPFALAFLEDNMVLEEIDAVINYFFMFDIVLNFFIGIHIKHKYVTHHGIIAVEYLKSWFIIDVLATFPLNLVLEQGFSQSNRIFRLARISKLSKLSKVFRLLKVSRFFKRVAFINAIQDYFNINYGISRLITFILSFVILSHIVGCMWYFLPLLYDEQDNWVMNKNLYDEDVFRKYIMSMYWAITTITTCGFGDISASNLLEYIFSLCWVFLGVLFYSFTIGTLSTILVNMNTKDNILAQKLNIINLYCREAKLSDEINKEMKRVIIHKSNNNLFSWIEKQEIFNNLPANLKCNVSLISYFFR